jgi:hypothetical protein
MKRYEPNTATFSTSLEWDEEVYNEETDEYETKE